MSVRDALIARFTRELGDEQAGKALVGRLPPAAMAEFERVIGAAAIATHPALALRAPTVPAHDIDSLIVFAFGNRTATDGSLTAGPMNEGLAAVVAAFVAANPMPVYAQWEVAEILLQRGVPRVTSIDPDAGPDGSVIYLSTAGVAAKSISVAASAGDELGRVGVVAFADHALRCVLTARAAGLAADVPAGLELPTDYDPQSGQAWTRERIGYLAIDLPARLALLGEQP